MKRIIALWVARYFANKNFKNSPIFKQKYFYVIGHTKDYLAVTWFQKDAVGDTFGQLYGFSIYIKDSDFFELTSDIYDAINASYKMADSTWQARKFLYKTAS